MFPVHDMFPRTIPQTAAASAMSPANADLAAAEQSGRSGWRLFGGCEGYLGLLRSV
jgi:hypothetical protein